MMEEKPFWRQERTRVGEPITSTSQMLASIHEHMERYEASVSNEQKEWVKNVYYDQALGSFLFQVNKIEGEGLDSHEETQQVIAKGLLRSGSMSPGNKALEAVWSLYRAFVQVGKADRLSVDCVLEAHGCLMSSSEPGIAGRLRNQDEVAYTMTTIGVPHVFMWPTEIQKALDELINDTNKQLDEILENNDGKRKTEQLLTLGARFFLEFENIHPFKDGNGRIGRVVLARILQPLMPFPNVLYVETMKEEPPFVDRDDYRECFEKAQAEQEFELVVNEDGDRSYVLSKEAATCEVFPPKELLALIIEGVYIGWKRLFEAVDAEFGSSRASEARVSPWVPKWKKNCL